MELLITIMSNIVQSLSYKELDLILLKKDSDHTNKATKVAIKTLRSYVKSKDIWSRLLIDDLSKETLNEILYSFYAELRTIESGLYKKNLF